MFEDKKMLTTKLSFVVPHRSNVIMNVYYAIGNLVATPVNENKPAGMYRVNFDAKSLPSGTYSYKVETGNNIKTKKLVLD
jgi:hypothetical protein